MDKDKGSPDQEIARQPVAALYVTRLILGRGNGRSDETVLMHHQSLEELASYLNFNNLLIGNPGAYKSIVSVEHTDGSPLSEVETRGLSEKGVNIQAYRQRIKDAVGAQAHFLPESALNPNAGAAQVVIARSGIFGEGNNK